MIKRPPEEAYSFDDVLLLPNYSDVVPSDVNTSTRLTQNIDLNIPIVTAAMDTVTEALTAISAAREGGIGFIHRNMSIERQCLEVKHVKKSESGMIVDPVITCPDVPIREVLKLMEQYRISGVPVTEGKRLVGIVTNRDLRFETNLDKKGSDVMTKENLVTVSEGIDLEESKILLHKHRIEKLLVVKNDDQLTGMITIKDIEKIKKYPKSCKDSMGRLRVGAAIGVGADMEERATGLVKAGADVLLIDTSHGHSLNVINAVKRLKEMFADVEVIAGNVGTAKGAEELIDAGVAAVKIGIGPGSICTTRIIAGVVSTILLSSLLSIIMLFSGYLYLLLFFETGLDLYVRTLMHAISMDNFTLFFTKNLFFGFFVILIPIYSGLQTSMTYTGIPIAVLNGMVKLIIAIISIEVILLLIQYL